MLGLGETNQNVKVVVDGGVEIVRKTIEIASGPTKSNSSGEHWPECEHQNGS